MHLSINRLATVLLCAGLLWAPHPGLATGAERIDVVPVGCRSCLLIDDKGHVLFERRSEKRYPNASTTKMVTALVVEGTTTGEEEVVVSPNAEAVPGGKLSLYAGERWSVDELLQALLMNSSNDAAVALAEHVSGSEEAFVERMNAAADALGATHTVFVTSHGLDSPGHLSSARDLALFAEELLARPRLAEIVGTREASIAAPGRHAELENTNLLLESYRGAIGVKTGYTALAGNVLVAAAERKGRRLVAVAMGSEDPFVDSAELLDAGFKLLRRTVLLTPKETLGALVSGGGFSTVVVAAREIRGMDDPDDIVVRFVPHDVRLPLEAGDEVGYVELLVDEVPIRTVPAVALSGIPAAPRSGWASTALATVLKTAASLVPGEDGPR